MIMIGQQEEIREYKNRYSFVFSMLLIAFFLLFTRIWYLQILKGKTHYAFSQQQSLRQEKIPGPRGIIYDRHGLPLVDNIPAFDIALIPQLIKNKEETIQNVSQLLQIETETIQAALHKARKDPPFQPVVIKANVSRDEVARVESHLIDMPALEVRIDITRKYLFGEIGAHLLGMLGQISQAELDDLQKQTHTKYDQFSFIGKSGLEKQWEDYLSGTDGYAYVAVDSRGYRRQEHEKNIFGFLSSIEEQPGHNLYLTIDQDLQNAAYEALKNEVGSVVALNPKTGEVLAMISNPAFDATIFSRGVPPEDWKDLVNNPYKPLKNKAIQDHYPPGSTYKVITAIAGLEDKKITPTVKYNCNGLFRYMGGLYRCWQEKGHGLVSLHRAIGESCDVFFYNTGVLTGIDRLAHFGKMFGLGQKTGILLENEQPGLAPTQKWRAQRFGSPWIPGETVSNAIGQGFNLVTPLQLANVYATIANGGKLFRPYLVSHIETPQGNTIKEFHPELISEIEVPAQTVEEVKQGLWEAVNKPGGTAYYRARLPEVDVLGKTGTSQVVSLKEEDRGKKCHEIDFKFRDHALFAAFAPRNDSEIAVGVVVEHGCHGSSTAAPIAKAIIEAYFYKKKILKEKKQKKELEEHREESEI
ncbi:MAG: penicillin-binding protein 2 [Deltaproteobacteria bacterium]|nr:penicillin-binding protein 2 [Deltaproteobacteria bacterium]